MGKWANRTCKECGIMRPIYRMEEIYYEVYSGRSGVSASISPFSSKPVSSTRFHSGRKYYRKRKAWVCKDREAHNNLTYYDDLLREAERVRQLKAAEAEFFRKQIARWKEALYERIRKEVAIEEKRIRKERAIEEKRIRRDKALEEERIREAKKRAERIVKNLSILQNTEETIVRAGDFRRVFFEGLFASDQGKEVAEKLNKCMVNYPEKFVSSSKSVNMEEFIFDYLKFIPVSDKRSIPLITQEIISSDPFTKIINLSEFKRILLLKKWLNAISFVLLLFICLDIFITDPSNYGVDEADRLWKPWVYAIVLSLIPGIFSIFYKQDFLKRHQIFLGEFCSIFATLNNYFHSYYAKVMITKFKEDKDLQHLDNPSLSELLHIHFQPFYVLENNPESFFTFNSKTNIKINGLTNKKFVQDNFNETKEVYSEEISNYLLEHKHLFSEILESSESFNIFCFIFAYQLSGVDGHFDEVELQAINEFFQITKDDVNLAKKIIDMNSIVPVSNILSKLVFKNHGKNPVALEHIINNLFYIAECDGTISQEELDYIRNLSENLKISKSVFEKIHQNQRQIKDKSITSDVISVDEFIDDVNYEFSSENNLIISGRMHVSTLQKIFEESYGVKLRVYKSFNAKGHLADAKQTLGSLSQRKIESIQIIGSNTVEEVETLFREKLGIGVQLASIDNSRLLPNKKKIDEYS